MKYKVIKVILPKIIYNYLYQMLDKIQIFVVKGESKKLIIISNSKDLKI